jgi:hypothetical protein
MEYQPAAAIVTDSNMRRVARARIRVRIERFLNMANRSEVRGVPQNQALKRRTFFRDQFAPIPSIATTVASMKGGARTSE